jgi:hypothetical protein
MRRSWVVVGASLLITASGSRAEDEQARTALNQAFARQKALPGYVEHQFGRLPPEPGAAETLVDMVTARVKEKATEKLQENVAQATAHALPAAALSDRALTLLDEQADAELVIPMGPEREIVTVEHSGTSKRQVLADGRGEVVRGGGQMAYKYTVPAQATAMRLATTVESTAEVVKEARSTIASIKAFSSALAKGGASDILGAAMAGFDEVTRLLHDARSTADLVQATVMLERLSGAWLCQPDPLPQYPSTLLVVEPLADETLGDAPAHVYFAAWGFGSAEHRYQLESRVWLRVSDGLPLRSELSLPGGNSVRTDFEYPAIVEICLPRCAAPPS